MTMIVPEGQRGGWANARAKERWLIASIGIALVVLAGCILVLGSVPPVDRDALTHHLAVPKLYLKHGGMVEIPSVPFSYYPMNLDLLYLAALYFGNDILPKNIHFAFALLTAWLIYGYLRARLQSPLWGLLGALLFLSLPVIVKLSVTVYVDLGLIFFSTAALLMLLKWAGSGFPMRLLMMAAGCLGLAVGTKLNGLISLLLLTCMLPILYVRAGEIDTLNGCRGKIVRPLNACFYGAVFVLVTVLVYSPWMVRNALWTGNPVYPLYQGFFSSLNQQNSSLRHPAHLSGENGEPGAGEGVNHFVARRIVFNESLLETLSIPLRIFFQGADDNPRLFDGRLNPYLIIFPLFAFFGWKRSKSKMEKMERTALLAFATLYVLFVFFQTDMRIRYVGPAIPPLVILATLGLHDLIGLIKDRLRKQRAVFALGVLSVGLVGLFGLNLSYLADQFRVVAPFSYLSGKVSRDQYIQKFRAEYDVIRYANEHLPQGGKIFCLFMGNRIYYSDHDMIQMDQYFSSALQRSATAAELSQGLRRRGVEHLLVRMDILGMFADGFDAGARGRLDSFFLSELETVFESRGYGLFRLRGSS